MKDLNGNELQVGDVVFTKVGLEWLQGTVTELKPGGTILAIKNAQTGQKGVGMTPEVVVVTSKLVSAADPSIGVHNDIAKLCVPPTHKTENGGPKLC